MIERDELLGDADCALASALAELSTAHTLALDAEEYAMAAGISEAMTRLEKLLGFTPSPRPTHRVTEAVH